MRMARLEYTPFRQHLCLLAATDTNHPSFVDDIKTKLENEDLKVTRQKSEEDIVKSQYVVFLLTRELLEEHQTLYLARLACEKARAHGNEYVIVVKFHGAIDCSTEPCKRFYEKLRCEYCTQLDLHKKRVEICVDRILRHLKRTKPKPAMPLNLGASMALMHFNGYLKHVVPKFREYVLSYTVPEDCMMCSKFLHVIPTSSMLSGCVSNKYMQHIEVTPEEHFQFSERRRCGLMKDFKLQVWTVTKGPKKFRCVAESPSALATLDDLEEQGEILKGRKKWEIIQFYSHLDELVSTHPKCRDVFIPVYFDEDGKKEEDLADMLVKIIEANPENTRMPVAEKKPQLRPRSFHDDRPNPILIGGGSQWAKNSLLPFGPAPPSPSAPLVPPSPGVKLAEDSAGPMSPPPPPPPVDGSVLRVPEGCPGHSSRRHSTIPVQESVAEAATYSSEGQRRVLHLNTVLDVDWEAKGKMESIFEILKLEPVKTSQKMTSSEMERCVYDLFNEDCHDGRLHNTALFVCIVTSYWSQLGGLCDSDGFVFSQSELTSVLARTDALRNVPLIFIIDAASAPPRTDMVPSALTTHGSLENVAAVGVSSTPIESGFEYDGLTVYACPPGEGKSSLAFWELLRKRLESSKDSNHDLEQILKEIAPQRDPKNPYSEGPYSEGSLRQIFRIM